MQKFIRKETMRKIFLVIILLVVNIQLAQAETLTMDQALKLALDNNPKLQAAQAMIGISEARIVIAKTLKNPAFVTDNGTAEKTYRAGLEQTFELDGKRKKRTNLAKAEKEVVENEIKTVTLDLKNSVRKSYIKLFNAQQRYNASNDILKISTDLVNIAKKRNQAGDIAELDVIQAETLQANAKNDLETSKLQINQSFNELNMLVNQTLPNEVQLEKPTLTESLLKTDGTDKTINELISEAYGNRPEIKKIQKSLEASDKMMAVVKANRIPNLTLSVGPDVVTAGGEATNGTSGGVFLVGRVDLPIFNRQQGQIKEVEAQVFQQKKELAAMQNQISYEIQDTVAKIKINQRKLQLYEKEILPKSQDVVDKSKRSFEEGMSNIIIPINAQQSYINTRFGYIQVLTDYQSSISDLERNLGLNSPIGENNEK
jgi:cobalt-zinc-cadmium efflux system outer membrane protein